MRDKQDMQIYKHGVLYKVHPKMVVKNTGSNRGAHMSSPEMSPLDLVLEDGSRPCLSPKVMRKQPCLPSVTLIERIQRRALRCTTQDKRLLTSCSLSSHLLICFIFRSFEGEMTTPRNSMSGGFPADSPMKRPLAMQPVQKIIPRTMPSMVDPTQGFFIRESKAFGVSQLPSVPYPGDALACRSRCYRPSTELNAT